MIGLELLTLTTCGLVALGGLEVALHRRHLKAIPVRIHVNGTRGKSSVTRLIAAGLREHGTVTVAKTTGTLPRVILPDGHEVPVFRPGRANVVEQKQVVALAPSLGAQVLVVECMAVQPTLQWLSEAKLVRATHGVITNCRPDHLDVMGPTDADVARALCGMVPPGGKLFTAELQHLPILEAACQDRKATLHATDASAVAQVSDAELQAFSYTEHRENVALALQVCAELGVPRATALQGMGKASADAGALTEYDVDFFGRRLVFINGFAANDPVSTASIWATMVHKHQACAKRIAVFNCRDDRPDRSVQLAESYGQWPAADRVVVMGNGSYLFARAAARAGLNTDRLVIVEQESVEEIFETIVSLVDSSAMIMGLGNIGGQGLNLVRYFRNRSTRSRYV